MKRSLQNKMMKGGNEYIFLRMTNVIQSVTQAITQKEEILVFSIKNFKVLQLTEIFKLTNFTYLSLTLKYDMS